MIAEFPDDEDLSRAAVVGLELGALSRPGSDGDNTAILEAIARLIGAPASTASDALAFAVTARSILPLMQAVNDDPMIEDCMRTFLQRTIETLEHLSGEDARQYAGTMPLPH